MEREPKERELTPGQYAFMAMLLSGMTIEDAAQKSETPRRTVTRWLSSKNFQAEYQKARRAIIDQALVRLQLHFDKALSTIDKHLTDIETEPKDQIKAAEIIIRQTIQTAELQKRINELEQEKLARDIVSQEDSEYMVTFDLRHLTKEERSTLASIDEASSTR